MKAKNALSDLAVFGGPKIFPEILPVGQMNVPSWQRFQERTQGIFDRRYYTNHGVLAQELEEKLADLFQVRNAVTMTNATIGLSLAAVALGLKGKVIVPSFTFAASAQALSWAGLTPVFCDINPRTHTVDAAAIAPLFEKHDISGVLGVHLWGNACAVHEVESIALRHGAKVFYDAAHAVGCTHGGKPIGNFGSCEVFSFHATKVLNATEGGCVTTNDDGLAEILRNLRSSYGRHKDVPIPINANGRFSEFQAAFCLLSLEDFAGNCAANHRKLEAYREGLAGLPGLRLIPPTPGEKHNYQYVVFELSKEDFGLSRDELVRILDAENIKARRYFVPGLHKSFPYCTRPQPTLPNTEALCEKVFQLPSGAATSLAAIEKVCELIRFIHKNSSDIRSRM